MAPASSGSTQDLENRVLQDCAVICIDNAQKVIDLVSEDYTTSGAAIGRLPWWFRIFYLWIATLHLIAAMLRPDVFKPMILDHWNKAMATLYAHEHISPSIQRCTANFRGMWQKVTDIRNKLAGDQDVPDTNQLFFQHLGFDAGGMMSDFGVDDMTWLNNVDWDSGEIGS